MLRDRHATARCRRSSTRPSSRCTRSRRRPTAASTSPRRPTARSTRSTPTARRARSSIPTTSTSGRSPSIAPGNALRRHRRQGRHLQDHARTARATRFYKTKATNVVVAGVRRRTGNLLAGTESPGASSASTRAARRSCCSTRPSARSTRCASTDDGTIYARRVSGPTAADERPRADRPCTEPARAPVPVGLDGDHRRSRSSTRRSRPEQPAAPRVGAAARDAARSTASGPTACGTPSGSRATTRRTTLLSSRGGSLLVGTGTKGKIFRVAGDPPRATLVARADAQQVTALLREPSRTHRRRHREPGQAVRAVAPAAPTRGHLRVRRARRRHGGDAGARSAGARTVARRAASSCRTRSGNTRDARRNVERVVRGRTAAPRASRSRARRRATCSGAPCSTATGAHAPVLTSVTAAYLPRNLRPEVAVDHRPPAGHRLPEAVLDGRGRDRRASRTTRPTAAAADRRRAPAGPGGHRPRRSAGGSTRRGCRRSSGRPRTTTTTTCSTTCSIAARAKRRGRR